MDFFFCIVYNNVYHLFAFKIRKMYNCKNLIRIFCYDRYLVIYTMYTVVPHNFLKSGLASAMRPFFFVLMTLL